VVLIPRVTRHLMTILYLRIANLQRGYSWLHCPVNVHAGSKDAYAPQKVS